MVNIIQSEKSKAINVDVTHAIWNERHLRHSNPSNWNSLCLSARRYSSVKYQPNVYPSNTLNTSNINLIANISYQVSVEVKECLPYVFLFYRLLHKSLDFNHLQSTCFNLGYFLKSLEGHVRN